MQIIISGMTCIRSHGAEIESIPATAEGDAAVVHHFGADHYHTMAAVAGFLICI
jgi:hypothetical protein